MTDPCPAPLGCRWEAAVYALRDAAGLRLVIARDRDGAAWTVYGPTGVIFRDGVSAERLALLLGVDAADPTSDKAQLAALGQRGDQG